MSRPPLPPFTRETAIAEGPPGRGRAGTRAIPSRWRWPTRRTAAGATGPSSSTAASRSCSSCTANGTRELDYRLIKELWAFAGNRIAVRFAYEWHDDSGNWFRSYGNENWEFDDDGLMRRRIASINDLPIERSRPQVPLAAGPAAGRPSRA